ncbi:MAG: hypothetical protein ABIJ45_13180 [Candidatus Zixiibacteriota bacterium]
MALHDDLTNEMIEKAVNSVPGNLFNTLRIVELLKKQEPVVIEELQEWSPRNWRAVIGKAVKRYAVETNKIDQASPPTESPARWKKRNA